MAEKHLLLWLEAPLQSWGVDSKFGRRDTLDFPTRSGVMGILLCAMGAGGEQQALLANWATASMQVQAYARLSADQAQLVTPPPALEDFHMVGAAYNDADPWENLFIPKTAEGKKQVGSGAKITYRYYLQDMAYAVLIKADEDLIDTAAQALCSPVWDIYLGRKCCAPTDFVFQGVYTDEASRNAGLAALAERKSRGLAFKVLEGEHEGERLILNDLPLQFGPFKSYADRVVTVQKELS